MHDLSVTSRETRMLIGLMLAFFATILNLSMFSVAAPHIKAEFGLAADTTSWLTIVYTIPFILLMPVYGRLGDRLGKRRMLITGAIVYVIGSVICALSTSFGTLAAGRAIQGVGSAALNPLCLSLITEHVSPQRRGKAIGTWSTAGPFTGTVGPLFSGLLIESFGWRTIFLPSVVISLTSLFFISKLIPKDDKKTSVSDALRSIDFPGFLFLGIGLTFTVFYISSRAITGRVPFTDWRMLLTSIAGFLPFVLWERRTNRPMLDLRLLTKPNFVVAAGSVALRMILLGGVSFLIPLYAADLLKLDASQTGLVIVTHAVCLFLTMRLGGILADRWSNRKPVAIGLLLQALSFIALGVQSGSSNVVTVVIPLMVAGAAAGLSLASLHHTAMHELSPADSGAGAGLYSMLRFTGSLVGAAVPGIVLEFGLRGFSDAFVAYRVAFFAVAAAGVVGAAVSLLLKELVLHEQ